MTKTSEARNFFQIAAAKARYRRTWFPTIAWVSAIKTTSKRDFNNQAVSKAIMSIVGNEGSTFTQDGKEFRVFHHRKSIKMQGSKPNVHFFWVQPSKFQESPLYPKEADFWSTRFLQHAVTRQESQKQKRSQGDERDNCQQSSNKRSKMSSAQDKGSKELPISQEQVDTTAALVAEKQKLDTASPTNDDDNDTRLPQKRTREEFIAMLKASWHASYPNEPFPEEIISSNESSSRDAIVSDSSDDSNSDTDTEKTTNPPKKSGRYRVKDVTLPNGYIVKDVPNNYMVISTSELSFYKYDFVLPKLLLSRTVSDLYTKLPE
jgi:hypothetical protein